MGEFAAPEGVSLAWEPFEGARFSEARAQVLEVHLHPSALPPRHRLTITPEPSVPSTLTSTIRLKPSSCVTAAKPALPEEACEPVSPGQIDPSDVAIVIDSSASTSAPSGLDVNRDGTTGWAELNVADATGTLRPGRFIARIQASDPGDSVLARQVAAARSLVEHAAQADVRFAVISHSDIQPKKAERSKRRSRGRPEEVGGVGNRNRLTSDGATLGSSLDQVLEQGSAGGSSFSAAMTAANAALLEPGDDLGARRRLVVFISDNPLSTSDSAMGEAHRADPDMKTAAEVAIEARIVFHTFGLGRAAATPPPHSLSRIAGATGGRYRSIDLGSDFPCELTRALAAR